MGIRVEYTVHELPQTYVTKQITYSYEPSPDDPKIKVRKETVVEHKGGYLIRFMRGHSIRILDDAHLAAFNAAMRGSQKDDTGAFQIGKQPRLIDESSGLPCNQHGVPLDIEHLVAASTNGAGGDMPELGIEGADADSVEAQVSAQAQH